MTYNPYYNQLPAQPGADAGYYGAAPAAGGAGAGGYGSYETQQVPGAAAAHSPTAGGVYQNLYGASGAVQQQQQQQGGYYSGSPATAAGYNPYGGQTGGVAASNSSVYSPTMQGTNDYVQQQSQQPQQGYYSGLPQHQQQQQQPPLSVAPQQGSGFHYGGSSSPPTSAMPATGPASPAPPAPPATNSTDSNGLRWTWSCYPTTVKAKQKESASAATVALPEMVIPMSCMYTPLCPIEPSHMVLGASMEELCCKNCGAFCNMHSQRVEGQYWVCLSCKRRNAFMANSSISEQHPALLYETVEYVLPPAQPQLMQHVDTSAPAFIFVVDTCIPSGEMASLRTSLLESLQQLPRHTLVGLISFGAMVSVWELGSGTAGPNAAPCPVRKCYLLRGNTANPAEALQGMLQVSNAHPVRGRLLAPLHEVEATLISLIEELEEDGAPVPASKRPLRATSTAVEAATYLMEALAPPHLSPQQLQAMYGNDSKAASAAAAAVAASSVKMGKILLFTGGPCTRGPGAVVSTDKADMMRFHRDIIEGETPYYAAAFNFYSALEPRLTAANACLDVFAQSLDQVGVMEMRRCIDNTGGSLVIEDETTDVMFLESLARYWQRCDLRAGAGTAAKQQQQQDENHSAGGAAASPHPNPEEDYCAHCGFGVHIEVNTSSGTLLRGALGPCNVDVEANKKLPARQASPLEIGVGGTTRWRVSSLDQGMTLSFIFDTATADGKQGSESVHEKRFIQFVTRYVTPRGEQRVRVTSIVQPVAPSDATPDYFTQSGAFDQTCAATVVARLAVSILERHPGKWDDAKRWLDTLLVRFVRRYSTFTPNQPNTLQLNPCLSLFPSFMYNLRRSEYFMVLNISPDETTFKRHWLMRESVDNCMLMIQPTLDSYDIEHPYATAVQLDSSSLRHDNIVLMDAYFNVHIMWGSMIYQWIEAGYHENPDYANFAELLEAAEQDAQSILAYRYPYPRFSRTDADGSEARHVKTRVNPATTYQSSSLQYGAGPNGAVEQADVIYTDDASIMTFMASLKKAVVTPDAKMQS
jgi:protein transport protein SEC23